MAQEYWPIPCPHCRSTTQHVRSTPDVNHTVYALLTIFTCGAWGLVWLFAAIMAHFQQTPWVCTNCGSASEVH